MAVAILLKGLAKTYESGPPWKRKRVAALKPLDLEVPEGCVFGLLGLNGAGKTTIVKLILRLLKPTSGSVEVLGGDLSDRRTRRQVGYLPELPYFSRQLTAREILGYFGSLFGLHGPALKRKVGEILDLVRLAPAADQRVSEFSKGMQQRLGIGQALLGDPRLLFCDEPMSGLDPVGNREMRDVLLDLKRAGTTVFMNTHILDEVERLCDRIAVLQEGCLAADVPIASILSEKDLVPYTVELPPGASEKLRGRVPGGTRLDGDILTVTGSALPTVLDELAQHAVRPANVRPLSSAVEAYFLRTIGHRSPGGKGGAP